MQCEGAIVTRARLKYSLLVFMLQGRRHDDLFRVVHLFMNNYLAVFFHVGLTVLQMLFDQVSGIFRKQSR